MPHHSHIVVSQITFINLLHFSIHNAATISISIIFLYNTVYKNPVFSGEAFNISDKSIKVKWKSRDLSSWNYARQSKELKTKWNADVFFSMWGKFLDISKCHFGEGDSRNIKLYSFVEAGFSSVCQGSVSGLNEDYWSFHCSITWPVAASLEGLEGLRAPYSPFIMGNRGQIPGWCGHEQREVDACSSGSWIPALVLLQAVCQQFISRILPVNIFLNFFFSCWWLQHNTVPPILIHCRKIENISASYSVVTNVHSRCCVNFHRTKEVVMFIKS